MDSGDFDPEHFRSLLLLDIRQVLEEIINPPEDQQEPDLDEDDEGNGNSAEPVTFSALHNQLQVAHLRVVSKLEKDIEKLRTSQELLSQFSSKEDMDQINSIGVSKELFTNKEDTDQVASEAVSCTVVDFDQGSPQHTIVDFDSQESTIVDGIALRFVQESGTLAAKPDLEDSSPPEGNDDPCTTTSRLSLSSTVAIADADEDIAIKVRVGRVVRLDDGHGVELATSYCKCHIKDKEETGFQTATVRMTRQPMWNYEDVVPEFTAGDELVFSIYDRNRHGTSELFGYVELDTSSFLPGDFEGKLEFTDAVKGGRYALTVSVEVAPKGPAVALLPVMKSGSKTHKRRKSVMQGSKKLFGSDTQSQIFEGSESVRDPHCYGSVLIPDSYPRVTWDICGIAILVIDLAWIPMQVFSPVETAGIRFIGSLTLAYWTGDMLLAFNTGYYNSRGSLILKRSTILQKYLRGWFVFDFSLVAIDWVTIIRKALGGDPGAERSASAARAGRLARIARMIRLLRLLRLAKLRRLLFTIQTLIDSEWLAVFFVVVKNMVTIITLNHYIACIWFLIGKTAGNQGWVERLGYHKTDYGVQYLESLGWSLSQFTPGGTKIYPEAIGERVFAVVVCSMSLVIATCFVGSISATMGSVWASDRYKNNQGFLLKKFLNQTKISRDLASRVTRYVDCVVELRHRIVPISKVEYIKLLSGPLNVELHTSIFQPYLLCHPFFERLFERSKSGMKHICSMALETEHYAKNDSVFLVRSAAKQMYFITKGRLGYRFTNAAQEKHTVLLEWYHWCSEHALWIQWHHRGHAKGVSDCEVISLRSAKFWDILSKSHNAGGVLWKVACDRAVSFAAEVRTCQSFGSGYVTDIPREHMAILLSEEYANSHANSEIHRAEHIEMEAIGFSDSDSEQNDEDFEEE